MTHPTAIGSAPARTGARAYGAGASPRSPRATTPSIDCGWGRLLFAQTFPDAETPGRGAAPEGTDRRDIAFYVRDPHVVLAAAPQELFLDPSHTFRLDLSTGIGPSRAHARPSSSAGSPRWRTRTRSTSSTRAHGMVPVPPDFFWTRRDDRDLTVLVAEDADSGAVIGTVMGVDHARAFDDPEHGASLWCLAVDRRRRRTRVVGEALVRRLAEHFQARGAAYLDLSVMHDNAQAIALYEKLGFGRVPVFAVKRKNPINERLFAGPAPRTRRSIPTRGSSSTRRAAAASTSR